MNANTKIIFSDLDETLLTKDKIVTERTKAAVRAIQKAGYIFVPCTGAPYDIQINRLNDMGIKYIITSNGGFIYDIENNEALHYNSIGSSLVQKIYDLSDNYIDDYEFHLGTISKKMRQEGLVIQDMLNQSIVPQICVFARGMDKIPQLREFLKILKDFASQNGLNIANYSKVLDDDRFAGEVHKGFIGYDIVKDGISKGSGITKFCEIFDIDMANTIAIGDGFNDVAMFKAAGYSVAMGNSLDKVKQMANHVTDTNNNDGVAKFLESLL